MKLASLAFFAAGYVLGSRAGRERYAEIVEAVERTSRRLEAFSARRPPDRRHQRAGRAGGAA